MSMTYDDYFEQHLKAHESGMERAFTPAQRRVIIQCMKEVERDTRHRASELVTEVSSKIHNLNHGE
jgi:hypothetical protein